MKEITAEEREQFLSFWRARRQEIEGHVSNETLYWFNVYTADNNIGYNYYQIRPGKLGQWDLYFYLTNHCDDSEALTASNLTAAEIAEAKQHEQRVAGCVDPDFEASMSKRLQDMSPDQLNAEIIRLKMKLDHLEQLPL